MRLKAYQFIDEHRSLGIKRGGIWMFLPSDAIKLLDEAETNELALLGFDGFFLRGETTQPSLADGWDYSGGVGANVDSPYDHARRFIKQRTNSELYFEIVLADRISAL